MVFKSARLCWWCDFRRVCLPRAQAQALLLGRLPLPACLVMQRFVFLHSFIFLARSQRGAICFVTERISPAVGAGTRRCRAPMVHLLFFPQFFNNWRECPPSRVRESSTALVAIASLWHIERPVSAWLALQQCLCTLSTSQGMTTARDTVYGG